MGQQYFYCEKLPQYQKHQLLWVLLLQAMWSLILGGYHSLAVNRLAACCLDLDLVEQVVVVSKDCYWL